MTTELRHRLGDLADEALAGVPAPDDLWDRGRRYQRRRRAGTTGLALACVLLVSLVFGATWQRDPVDSQPTGEPGQVYLPDHFFVPSPWAAGTDDDGPLGRLVAILGAIRKSWTSTTMGIAGVSATTGEYRFLDLPNYVDDETGTMEAAPSLSPDGRYVAYWLTGDLAVDRPTWSGSPIVGYAVYDAVSGEVRQHRVETRLGLSPVAIAWTGHDAWFSFGQYQELDKNGSSSVAVPLEVMDTAMGETQALRSIPLMGINLSTVASASGEFVSSTGANGWRLVDDPDHPEGTRIALNMSLQAAPVLSPDGHQVAFLKSVGKYTCCHPMPPYVADVHAVRASVHQIDSDDVGELLGWRDDHLVVRGPGDLGRVKSLDLETGEAWQLTTIGATDFGFGIQVAADLWSAPTAPGHVPPSQVDPRVKAGLVVGLLLVAGYAIVVWRRRVRA